MPATVIYPLDEPVTIGGRAAETIGVEIGNFDPTLAPAGKTVLKVMFTCRLHVLEEPAAGPRALQGGEGERSPTRSSRCSTSAIPAWRARSKCAMWPRP